MARKEAPQGNMKLLDVFVAAYLFMYWTHVEMTLPEWIHYAFSFYAIIWVLGTAYKILEYSVE